MQTHQPAGDDTSYHGIIVRQSQIDRRVVDGLDCIGRRKVLLGFIVLQKVRVRPDKLDETVRAIQANMADRIMFRSQNFYAHFYRKGELIIVFRNKVFRVTPDRSTWSGALEYGRSLGIAEKQLDFTPCRFEDETY
jgi:hypothetical protein